MFVPLRMGCKRFIQRLGVPIDYFGTPNYWNGPTGQMKLLFDRMRPFPGNWGDEGQKRDCRFACGDGPKSCGPLVEMFRMSFDYLGMKFAGKILVTAYEKGEIAKNKKELKKAYDLGVSLK